jgi:hypothetical protein
MTRLHTALLVIGSLLLSACGASFHAQTPPGFVELDEKDSAYEYRAITADGLVLAVREIDHEPKGQLEFWVRAVENQMRQRGGYALIDTREVSCKTGQKGKQLRFGHDEGAKPYLYFVTVFVTPSTIYVLEAGGTKELMTSHESEVDSSVTEFVIK